jgi:apolipoprotein N-acyltransferase
VIDAPLPRAIPPTLYARFGDWMFVALLAIATVGLAALHHRDRRSRQPLLNRPEASEYAA